MNYDVELPEGTEITVNENSITIKGPKGELNKVLDLRQLEILVNNNLVQIKTKNKRKEMVGTVSSHMKNMVRGVNEGYEYKLKICYSHFPINVNVENNKIMIKNFLGEKKAREAKILEGVTIDIKGQDITVSGIDIEKVGQTAANIEQKTRVTGRDVRVFGDGIYITKKPSHKGE